LERLILLSSPLKIGFIGGSIYSAVGITHKISAQMDERWKLVAGCFSTHVDINKLTAEKWGIEREHTYSTYHELLLNEKNNLDAIVVLTPTPSHTDIVITALEYNYPVICEKALAASYSDILRIKKTLMDYKGYLAVTYNYTGYPMIRELKTIVENNKLGNIIQIHIEMPQEGFIRLGKNDLKPEPQIWRLKDYDIPTVCLDLGVHLHQIISFLTNQSPIEVIAKTNNFGFFTGIVDNVMGIAKYTNNLDCQFWFGKTALGHSNGLRLRIYGDKGSAEWYQLEPDILIIHDNKGSKHILQRSSANLNIADANRYNRFKAGHPCGFIEAFANYYYDLADSLIEFHKTGTFTSSFVFGINVAEEGFLMLDAISRSDKHKCWQYIFPMKG
jgi:predicted dehydrogenase